MRILAILLTLSLAACGNTGGLGARGDSPFAPAVDRRKEAVDGLLVGHRLMEAGEYELALRAYLRAAAEQGATAEVLTALGSANLRLGRLGQAEDLLRKAIDKDEEFVPALNNLGVVLIERGEIGEASRVFRIAVAADSGESDDIRANLALALSKLDESSYPVADSADFALVRRGTGEYRIVSSR